VAIHEGDHSIIRSPSPKDDFLGQRLSLGKSAADGRKNLLRPADDFSSRGGEDDVHLC
jgi:hypothetical protein